MEEKKIYIVSGMMAKCSEGSMENYLSTDKGHGIVYQGQPVLNANDHVKGINLTHFGDCHSKAIYEQAKKEADERYKAEEGDGFFTKLEKWRLKTVTKLGLSFKEYLSFNKCELDTPLPWIFTSKDHMIDGAPALTIDSQCTCRYGGTISIVPPTEGDGAITGGIADRIMEETSEAIAEQEAAKAAEEAAAEAAAKEAAEKAAAEMAEPNITAIPGTLSVALTQEQQEENARYIYNQLTEAGWSRNAILGLLGNVERECGLNPASWQVMNSPKAGYGLCHWSPARKILEKIGEYSNTDLKTDADYVAYVNNLAETSPKELMDMQLQYLIDESLALTSIEHPEWIPSTNKGSPHAISFETYIESEYDVDDMTLIFQASYERSGDNEQQLAERIQNAYDWEKLLP